MKSARPKAPSSRATPEALAALRAAAHPLRLRLLELFAQGARTTKQAAADLGEPPTRLYHHVHALERAGLVRLVATRAKRGTEEKYYELAPGVAGDARGRGRGRLGTALAHLDAAAAARAGMPLAVLAQAVLDATRADVATALTDLPKRSHKQHAGEATPLVARAVVPSAAVAADLRAELLAVLQRHRAQPDGSKASAEAPARAPGGVTARRARAARTNARQDVAPAGGDGPDEVAWSLTVVLVPVRKATAGSSRANKPAVGNAGPRR